MKNTNNVARDNFLNRTREHNWRCGKVHDMFMEENSETISQCIDTMRQANITTGIDYCCIMRQNKIDAVVDMIWGYVLPRDCVFEDEIMENGKKRYLTFEYVDKE